MNLDIQQKKRETVPKGMKESGPTILEMGGKIETTREVKDAKDKNDISNDLILNEDNTNEDIAKSKPKEVERSDTLLEDSQEIFQTRERSDTNVGGLTREAKDAKDKNDISNVLILNEDNTKMLKKGKTDMMQMFVI